MPIFLMNPKKRRKKKMAKRKTTKRKRSTSTAMKRKMAKVRSFKKNGGTRTMAKRRKKRKVKTVTVYKRKTVSQNPRRKTAKKRYKRNPRMPRTARGFGNQLFNGIIDAGEVVVGKATAKMIPQMIGIPSSGPMGLLTQALVAIGVGFLGTQMISSNAGKMMLAGALASPVEDMIKQMNIPFISPALGEGEVFIEDMNAYPQIGNYPRGNMGDYYAVGEEEQEEAMIMQ